MPTRHTHKQTHNTNTNIAIMISHIYNMVRGHMHTYHGLEQYADKLLLFFDFQYTAFYTNMPQRSEIFHKQPQYATNIMFRAAQASPDSGFV